jgi:glycine cleavage system aminomethyltransferase T
MNKKMQTLPHTPFEPVSDSVIFYARTFRNAFTPYEYTDWRDETISWKKTCYLHAGLNPTDTVTFKGPEVIKFLSRVCVTNFTSFPVGTIKHGLMCDEKGRIAQDGVLFRPTEEEVISYWMDPGLPDALKSDQYGNYNVQCEYLTGKVFLFQVGGPVSIDVLEASCGQSLRDLKFLRFKDAAIAGKPVRIARLGMAGTLSYEVHGAIEDAHTVYNAIYETGLPFGLRRLGSHCYQMNHAENGFPQYGLHFLYARDINMQNIRGSAADDINNYYPNPYEIGWGKMIKFDHDFVGREALEKIAAENKRQLVSLEWNVEDIADVFASQFRDGEPYKYIDTPTDRDLWPDFSMSTPRDKVLDEKGKMIGLSFGRQNAAYFQRMISICSLDTAYAEPGVEVIILWGDPGTRQKNIRAKVTRYPYNNVLRNESTDAAVLPKAKPQK